jgi:predicted Zn-dependent protease
VQWDDDGVTPEPYTVIDQGRVVDFHTTRETAPLLASWYERHGRPVRSHGGSVASTPENVPSGSGGHLTVAASPQTASLDDLMREISHGFLVINGSVGSSPGLTMGQILNRSDGLMVEIRHGVSVARTNVRMQFTTQSILGKNLRALGDATTTDSMEVSASKGIPWQGVSQWVTAPAALCDSVDVIV